MSWAHARPALATVTLLFTVILPDPARAQVRLAFDKRPSLEIPGVLSADVRVKTQGDFRDFPQESPQGEKDVFDLHRARLALEGTLFTRVGYQIEREFRDTSRPWRDVFVDARLTQALQIRGGQFKIPFGLDQLTGSMDLDFNYRSLAGSYLAPGRDVGLMTHGRLFHEVIRYQAGVFRHGGDNIRASELSDPQARRTFATRLVFKPRRGFAAGVAYTNGDLPEGRNSLRGKTVPGDTFFDRVNVHGRRQRIGAELQWRPSSFGLQGEFMQSRDERIGQGLDAEDLPDVLARGWYVSGTWLLTGERKKDSIHPARRTGAWEVAARIEQLRSFSEGGDSPFTTPRSPLIAPRSDTAWTAGLNWYVNDYIKVQTNLIRERRLNDTFWSRTLRLQFGL